MRNNDKTNAFTVCEFNWSLDYLIQCVIELQHSNSNHANKVINLNVAIKYATQYQIIVY